MKKVTTRCHPLHLTFPSLSTLQLGPDLCCQTSLGILDLLRTSRSDPKKDRRLTTLVYHAEGSPARTPSSLILIEIVRDILASTTKSIDGHRKSWVRHLRITLPGGVSGWTSLHPNGVFDSQQTRLKADVERDIDSKAIANIEARRIAAAEQESVKRRKLDGQTLDVLRKHAKHAALEARSASTVRKANQAARSMDRRHNLVAQLAADQVAMLARKTPQISCVAESSTEASSGPADVDDKPSASDLLLLDRTGPHTQRLPLPDSASPSPSEASGSAVPHIAPTSCASTSSTATPAPGGNHWASGSNYRTNGQHGPTELNELQQLLAPIAANCPQLVSLEICRRDGHRWAIVEGVHNAAVGSKISGTLAKLSKLKYLDLDLAVLGRKELQNFPLGVDLASSSNATRSGPEATVLLLEKQRLFEHMVWEAQRQGHAWRRTVLESIISPLDSKISVPEVNNMARLFNPVDPPVTASTTQARPVGNRLPPGVRTGHVYSIDLRNRGKRAGILTEWTADDAGRVTLKPGKAIVLAEKEVKEVKVGKRGPESKTSGTTW